MEETFYTYIVRCADGTLYTGWTKDLHQRIAAHNSDSRGAKYTRSRRPVELVYHESHATKHDAMSREWHIKRMSREAKVALITMQNTTKTQNTNMRINLGAKPFCYPQPVFIIGTYDENGTPDAMNAAWGGISDFKQISLCLSAPHKTVKNLLQTKAFTVSMATADQVVACDYMGIESGNNVPDKVARAGFHATKSEFVNAPLFDELPLAIECKVMSYDANTGCLIGEIVNVSADESIIGTNGNVDPNILKPIIFDPFNHTYLTIGEKVGEAFKDGQKIKKA